jgi:hypothetical protein
MTDDSILHSAATGFGWSVERMCQFLNSTPSGCAARDYYFAHHDKLRIWKSAYLKQQYRDRTAEAWKTYSLYGYTACPDLNGVIDIAISGDIIKDDFTAAATFVHEIEHARGWLTGIGGSEVDARNADMRFYVEANALALLPQEYFEKGIIFSKDGRLEVDYARLEAESQKWGGSDDRYVYGNLQYGESVQIFLEQITPALGGS